MVEVEVEIINRAGIHTRPASLIVKTAAKFKCEVFLIKDGFGINAKSIIGVMTMGAGKGTKLIITTEGEDEQEAAQAMSELISSGFGEP